MRLERLDMERYGIFQDYRLDLSGDAIRLHVIHGPNEAGKSTVLAAICDLLFGIEVQTGYDFVHGKTALLIGAALSNRRGDALVCKRRKGNKNTLLDADGGALPDGALAPFLGGVDRDSFTRMFGLDHDRLRQGGDRLREAEGDLARSLFQASSGLSGVAGVLKSLQDEADELGSPQRKSATKPLWQELGRYDDAQQRMRREALRSEEWGLTVEGERQAAAALDQARERLTALRREHSRLRRLRSVLPVLARLDGLAGQLDGLAGGPDLPADFAERWRVAGSQAALAAAELGRLTEQAAELRRGLAELAPPGALAKHGALVERLYRDSGDIASKRGDLPKLERDLQHSDGRLEQLVIRLGGGVAVADLDRLRPPQPTVARVRALIRQRGVLEAALKAAEELGAAQQDRRRVTIEAAAVLAHAQDPAEALAALDQAMAAGDFAARRAAAEVAARRDDGAAAAALARLAGWSGALEVLCRTAFPGAEAVERFRVAIQRWDDECRRAAEARDKAAADGRRAEGDLRALELGGGAVPTPEAVAQARQRRDRGWRLIRGRWLDRTPDTAAATVTAAEFTTAEFGTTEFGTSDGAVAGAYEESVHQADDLVDRREREARRVQQYLTLQRSLSEAEAEAARQAARLAECELGLAGQQAAWLSLWQPSGVTPGTPAEMLAWLQRKDEVVRAAETRLKSAAEVEALGRQAAAVRAHLGRAAMALGLDGGAEPTDELETPALRDRVKAAAERAARDWAERRRLSTELAKSQVELERAEAAVTAARNILAHWSAEWAEAMPPLGLSAAASPAEADAALEVWTAIEAELVDRRQRQELIRGIHADLAGHRDEVLGLVALVGDGLGAEERALDPLDLPPRLYHLWKAAQQRVARHTEFTAQITKAEAGLAQARRRDQEARALQARLRAGHGLSEDADALAEAERAKRRRELAAQLDQARHDLAALGDGRSELELRAEARDADPDGLAAEAQAIDEAEKQAQPAYEEAARAAVLARQQLEALRHRAGIGEAALQANDAALAAAELTARWVRLTAAQLLLATAIERFRAANEHPMLRRASDIFALIAAAAANPIQRLTVTYGRKDQPVLVGLRRDGSQCPVEGMSDGTRDQLYLALRIAAIEAAARDGEPMPFIADDLFITSDDQRTAPGLQALAELGASTQVLLFTHHRSVVDTARTLLPATELRVHELGRLG